MADFVPVTKEGLRAAMRDPRYWASGHPERDAYHRWVTEGWQALVREGQGKNGVVQVRAYTRTRNGKTERVGEHSRADPPGGDAPAAPRSAAGPGGLALPIRHAAGSAPPSPRPGITAASPTLVIFIGGGGDSKSGIVSDFEASPTVRAELGHRKTAYFTNDQQAAIIARAKAEPQETRIVLVGHSWGGDAAAQAQAAAALGVEGRPVDTLVTVDPVGVGLTDDYLRRVRAGSREWVNIRAYGAARDFSDFIAAVGRPYAARPRGYATQFMEVPRNHGNFNALLRYADPMGVSGFSRILGQ